MFFKTNISGIGVGFSLGEHSYVLCFTWEWGGRAGGTLCFRVVIPSVHHTLGVPLCVQRPEKTMPFQQIIMHELHCQHDVDVHLLFCFDLDLHITSSRDRVLTIFFVNSHWWVQLCVQHPAPSKSYAFSTNYHAWIAMPTWHRCAPPILVFPGFPYNFLQRSWLTWIFFVDSHWWVQLCYKTYNRTNISADILLAFM